MKKSCKLQASSFKLIFPRTIYGTTNLTTEVNPIRSFTMGSHHLFVIPLARYLLGMKINGRSRM